MRVGFKDQAGISVETRLYRADGAASDIGGWLAVAAGLSYRFLGTPQTYCFLKEGVAGGAGQFQFGANLWQHDNQSSLLSEASFVQGGSYQENEGAGPPPIRPCFRTSGSIMNTDAVVKTAWNVGGSIYSGFGGVASQKWGMPQLWTPQHNHSSGVGAPSHGWRFFSGDLAFVDPVVTAGLTQTAEAKIFGIIQDCFWTYEIFSFDAQLTISGKSYWAITGNNTGLEYNSHQRGTLFMRYA